jgi:hypothetical protein
MEHGASVSGCKTESEALPETFNSYVLFEDSVGDCVSSLPQPSISQSTTTHIPTS